MTRQEQKYTNLLRRAYFKTEARAWSHFDYKDAPWWSKMKRERTKLVKEWAKLTGRDLRKTTPEEVRRSITYQKMVKAWYQKHGWGKEITRRGKKVWKNDPFACMRQYSDEYAQGPDKDKYMPPWKAKEKTRAQRVKAIDKRFGRALGVVVR